MGTRSSNIAMKKVAIKNGFEHNSQYGQIDSEIIQYKKLIPIVSQNTESKIPSLIFGTRVIGIVANDSGGANQIYYLIKQIKKPVLAYLKGPASNIFKNGNIQYTPIKKFSDLKKCDLVVTGSGWMTDLEFNAIKFCEESNIPSLTVLDHWVNFKSRFSRKFEIVPNMLAVTNKIAFKFAEQDFQDIPIWLIPDFQLESYRLRLTNKPSGDKVLVLLEPNSGLSNDFYITRHMEFEIINKAIFFNNKEGCDGVIIRPHPSKNGFDSRLKNFITNFNDISISSNNKLEDDLVDAKLVLGFNSYGLYLSSMSGIKTYSYFANSFGHWTNSYPEILPIFNNSKFKN
jgi:hypothetical protein